MTSYPDRIVQLGAFASDFDPLTRRLANDVLGLPGFSSCSGSVSEGKHHYGSGGLQQHVWEVVNLSLSNRHACGVEKDVPKNHAFLAALYHDVGKVWDYEVTGYGNNYEAVWGATPHKRLINHMNRSALYWDQKAREANLPAAARDDILHAILAHHADHGSSVMPKTKLAWLLHLSDQLSAWMDQCDRRDPSS